MKRTLTIEYGEEVLLALGVTPEQFGDEITLLIGIKLYELGRLSAGAAADLAGLPKTVFLTRLRSYGVETFQQDEEELRKELNNAAGGE